MSIASKIGCLSYNSFSTSLIQWDKGLPKTLKISKIALAILAFGCAYSLYRGVQYLNKPFVESNINGVLCNEVLHHIFKLADEPAAISLVCKRWKEVQNSGYVYASILKQCRQEPLLSRFTRTIPLELTHEKSIEPVRSIYQDVRNLAKKHHFLPRRVPKEGLVPTLRLIPIMKKVKKTEEDKDLIAFITKVSNQINGNETLLELMHVPRTNKDKAQTIRDWIVTNKQVFTQITVLNLSKLELSTLPPEIGVLTNLTYLDLANNELTNLPDEISNLKNLQTLNLAYNKLTDLPSIAGDLHNLQVLDLTHNILTILSETIGKFTELRRLELSRNDLANLPSTIGNLIKLQKLNLMTNNLTILPETIGNLTKLEELQLRGNALTNLPDAIKGLVNLRELDLSLNRLTNIPESIGKLIELKHLCLGNNRITSVPESIGKLIKLKHLHLGNNRITSVPANFLRLVNLSYLNLTNNFLIEISKEMQSFIKDKRIRIEVTFIKGGFWGVYFKRMVTWLEEYL